MQNACCSHGRVREGEESEVGQKIHKNAVGKCRNKAHHVHCALCLVKFSRYSSCLYSRTQATDEGYVEDINGILNTGDLPNLYQLEDKATIMENMANVAKQVVSTDGSQVAAAAVCLLAEKDLPAVSNKFGC